MKVLLVNKFSRSGGAAIACRRLLVALDRMSITAKLITQEDPEEDQTNLIHTTGNGLKKRWIFIVFILERLSFILYEKSRRVRFMFSVANLGEQIFRNKMVQKADIIHLHWINSGMLSIRGLGRILGLGKPVVWTFHDMWSMTGGCHYALNCFRYKDTCGNCPFLRNPSPGDLSNRLWKKKKRIYSVQNLIVVTCSNWLKECVQSSSLFSGTRVYSIPNPIDHKLFYPIDRKKAISEMFLDSNKKYILYGAANINNPVKGFEYFREAMHVLHGRVEKPQEIEILLFGKNTKEVASTLHFAFHDFSYISSVSRMIMIYRAALLLVVPSLMENLSNTIMEALSCGTPVVAFNTGGNPEMIDHKSNGYLSELRSAEDLANGIQWILEYDAYEVLSENARKKVLDNFTEEKVALKYLDVYERLLKEQTL